MVGALAALILVSGSLAQVHLGSGQRLPAVARESEDTTRGEGAQALGAVEGRNLEIFLRVVLVLVMVLLLVSIIALLVLPELRKRFLARLIPLGLVLAALLLTRQLQRQVAATTVPLEAELGLSVEGWPDIAFDASPPELVVWVTRIAVGMTLALPVGIVLWLMWRGRRRRELRPLEQVAEQARHAIENLRAGDDVRSVILRCYSEMSRVLSDERGLTRQSSMTPREFERSLVKAGLPEPAVQRLTRLFEAVRYGAKIAGDVDEEQAMASLAAIVDACRGAA